MIRILKKSLQLLFTLKYSNEKTWFHASNLIMSTIFIQSTKTGGQTETGLFIL